MRAAALSLLLSSATLAQAGDIGSILAPLQPHVLAPGTPSAPATAAARPQAGISMVNEPEVLAALQQEISHQLNVEGDLRLAFARPWNPVRANGADWKITVLQTPTGGLSANMLVTFRIETSAGVVGEWQQVLRAQLWKNVWVASRRLDRGQLLDGSLCASQTVDTLRERQQLVPGDTDLSKYEMAQTVSQERPLAWRDVTLRPLVRKGQVVDVVAADGPLSISMKGVALSNGGAGEAVSIRNLESKKDFSAKVTGANTVQVAF